MMMTMTSCNIAARSSRRSTMMMMMMMMTMTELMTMLPSHPRQKHPSHPSNSHLHHPQRTRKAAAPFPLSVMMVLLLLLLLLLLLPRALPTPTSRRSTTGRSTCAGIHQHTNHNHPVNTDTSSDPPPLSLPRHLLHSTNKLFDSDPFTFAGVRFKMTFAPAYMQVPQPDRQRVITQTTKANPPSLHSDPNPNPTTVDLCPS